MRQCGKNYRERRYALTGSRTRPPCSYLNRSHHYYDAFHQGYAGLWRQMEQAVPEKLKEVYTQIPIPRTQTVPPIETPEDVIRELYHLIPPRDVEPAIRDQLNSELQNGTHPTTQALVPLGMRFLRILGAGSQGTAVLFEMDDASGTTKKLVAKYDSPTEENDDGEGLLQEKEWMRVSESGQYIQQLHYHFHISLSQH